MSVGGEMTYPRSGIETARHMKAPWPCSCGSPGVRNVGTEGKCGRHLAELYETFDPGVFKLAGVGLPGVSTDESVLTCCACGATWVGPAGESCYYCQRARRIQLEHQADLVLEAPDVDPLDITYETRMSAWAQRMDVAVAAGIITADEAQRAWQRIAGRERAA